MCFQLASELQLRRRRTKTENWFELRECKVFKRGHYLPLARPAHHSDSDSDSDESKRMHSTITRQEVVTMPKLRLLPKIEWLSCTDPCQFKEFKQVPCDASFYFHCLRLDLMSDIYCSATTDHYQIMTQQTGGEKPGCYDVS